MSKNKLDISIETKKEAELLAKKIKKPSQSKEQTKLIEQGIQKGIALYKKNFKEKQRQADKAKKKKDNLINKNHIKPEVEETRTEEISKTPWALLAISWICFAVYIFYTKV